MPRPLNLTPEEKAARAREHNRLRQQKFRARHSIVLVGSNGANVTQAVTLAPLLELMSPDVTLPSPAMPLDPASDPCLTPPVVSIDAKRLRELAAAGNDLWGCASALCVTPEAIERAIAPTNWATYSDDAQRAGQARIKLAIHRRAATGDARALELLHESQPTSGEACPLCRRIGSMTIEELRAERERLQVLLNRPKYGGFSRTPLPPTVHVILNERPVIARPKLAGELPA
jgi:hypothetical protein